MSESLEKEREGTFLATEESSSSRAERWVQSGEEWGTRSKDGDDGERQRRNTSGEKGAGKRRRPTKAELLGRERRDSSVASIPSSWFSRRGRARESEDSEGEQQAAKRKKEGKAGKSPEQQGNSEEKKMANLEEIEKMMERQLQRHKDDMMKIIRRELKEEMNLDDKKEIMIRRNKLTGTKIYVDDDLTKDERERQKEIRLWAKREKERGRRVKVGFGKAWMNGLKRKDEDFWDFLKDYDVIGLTETWVEEAGWGKIKEKCQMDGDGNVSQQGGKRKEVERWEG
ncbi:PREDICTED: DEAD-box ATP-dependent RNA helicase 42-like [Trachymyrmex septentrionalis]|uniref:DEAD-box ATP-dependent RNA helicase 42-like n=1 Tax=Trachymyrmex septentrionalis TaxID=34720 RepID=UPI00084F5231|nr:PREDICTED: DEAD-box ATP-dependent RNA helicase 42-like [Trachymyrmex septentrionalis]